VIPYDKGSHERIRGLLTYMRYTSRRILYLQHCCKPNKAQNRAVTYNTDHIHNVYVMYS